MAVYERAYRPYEGGLTPRPGRFLVLPRYAYSDVFRSRFFLSFFVACFVVPLGTALLIYLPHNLKFLDVFGLQSSDLLGFFRFDGAFFLRWFLVPQVTLSFVLVLIVGPALVSSDLRNQALPLYLSRPLSRGEYVLGKMSVLIILLSLITWVPGMLLFLLQVSLTDDWLGQNWRVGPGILLGSWIAILVLCLLGLALSAYLKWKLAAQAALFGAFFVAPAFGAVVNAMFETRWGSLFNLSNMMEVVWAQLFDVESAVGVPAWAAWMSLLTVCAGCLLLLARKVRAYEVVRS